MGKRYTGENSQQYFFWRSCALVVHWSSRIASNLMQNTIYLIGFMGSGKSHVGKKLAAALYAPHMDLDSLIESSTGMSIKEIFAKHSEAYFRLLERRALHNTAFGPKRIVATGGGAPCFYDNMDWINRHGLAIYLDATPQVLAERLWRGKAIAGSFRA